MKTIQQLLDLTGKSAIVTGGAKGIGLGIASRLAEAGAKVMIADMDESAAKASAEELTSKGWRVESMKVDVSNGDDISNLFTTTTEKFGGLDILVNNAGIYPPMPIMQMNASDFEKVLHVNLLSCFIPIHYWH